MAYTVLILGAGASQPYGFPVGSNLYYEVLGLLESAVQNQRPSTPVEHALAGTIGSIATRQLAGNLRGSVTSVDAFLERNPKFIDGGKIAIAACLMQKEKMDTLFLTVPRRGDWYLHLVDKLAGSWDGFCQKQELSIITYNYDRSLEHYIFTALKSRYTAKTEADAALAMKRLPIIHLHGQLGRLPWQGDGPDRIRDYTPDLADGALLDAARCIRVVHEMENIDNDPVFCQAHEELRKATHVYFLGFGYDARNIQRLQLAKHLRKEVKVYCNCYAIRELVMQDIKAGFERMTEECQARESCELTIYGFEKAERNRDILQVFENDRHLHTLGR